MLLTAFIIMKVFEGNYVTAVTSHFCGIYWDARKFCGFRLLHVQTKPLFDYLEEHSANEHEIAPKELLIETLKRRFLLS